jgi:hypothetical protein
MKKVKKSELEKRIYRQNIEEHLCIFCIFLVLVGIFGGLIVVREKMLKGGKNMCECIECSK